jgi:hypothetical protein
MPRVRSNAKSSNALVKKLESGNGSVKNMQLLLPVEGEALIPVVVVGIAFHTYTGNGVAVLVKPVGGYGALSVGATELLDDTPDARRLYTALSEAAEYRRNHTPKDSSSDKVWREAIVRERAAMTDKQRKLFDSSAKKHFREDVEMLAGIKEASSWTLKEVFRHAIVVRFGVEAAEDQIED